MDGHTKHENHETSRDRETRLRALIDAAFDGILVSRQGVIVEASQPLVTASGYSLDELIGRPVTDFVTPELRETVRQRHADGAEGRFDAVVIRKDGRHVHVEAVTMNHVIAGQPSRIVALLDVTERRRLEEQLRHAQKMEAVGQLAAGVAHDFNNILTVIRAYSDVLLLELEEPHRGDIFEVLKAADAGAALTRQLLAYARQETPNPMPVYLNAVVQDAAQILRRLLGTHVELLMDLEENTGQLKADTSQLQQVILNLAVNARDAMPHGGMLMVRTRNIDVTETHKLDHVRVRPGRYVMLAVTDSGTGMPKEIRDRIFEAFFTTKEPGRGTGLGLAIVERIVEQSKGFIVVDSTVGVGSTFAIYLPRF